MRSEIALLLGAEQTAAALMADAGSLSERLPGTLAAMEAGRLRHYKAAVKLLDATGTLDGAIPAALARELAADPASRWYRLLHDPAGRLIDFSSRRYRPPRSLTELVRARDQECRMPICTRPAEACDLDHRAPFRDGGDTGAGNLDASCPRHHTLKHTPDWRHDRDPDTGESWWTTPTGRRYPKPAEPLPRDGTLPAEHGEPPPF